MKGAVVAAIAVAAILIGAGAGYLIGSANQRTVTSLTTAQTPYSECGFITSCSTTNPSGIVLSMEMNTTSIGPNGSLAVNITEFNPTQRYINMSVSDNWFLSDLPDVWLCTSPPYGLDIFRGYYTLQNVSIARNILNFSEFGVLPNCSFEGNVTGFSFKPGSLAIAVGSFYGGYLEASTLQFGATSVRCNIWTPSTCMPLGDFSLWSNRPAAYTIAVGDEWGDLLLAHFSVVATG